MRRKASGVAAVVAALSTAAVLGVSPAAAATSPYAVGCDASPFSALAALTGGGSAARGIGGIQREPASNETAEEVPDSARGKGGKGFSASVPVWFHVISPDGTTGNVSNAVLQQQLQVMNTEFGGFEGGAATGFSFKLAGVDRVTNPRWYDFKSGTKPERDMKQALRRGGPETLNVYTTSGAGFLGWAYFPSTYKTQPYLDGIVIDWRSMPGGPYGTDFSLGKTLTHEAGHWLGLYHTFQGGCNAKGDYVDDTPFELTPTSGCPSGKDTCSEPGLDPIHNYMDYSFDSCYSEFTPDQAARMQDQWLFFRA